MNPTIDVHAHIFSAIDIPLKGYLLSRKYEGILKFLAPLLIPILARCVRAKLDTEIRGNFLYKLLCPLTTAIAYAIIGKEYKKWVATLSTTVIEITSELIETYKRDGIDLFIPLMIDYEYWFKSTPDTAWKEQVDSLGGNAMRFLGLHPGGKNRERLKTYYSNHDIEPPKWFKTSSSHITNIAEQSK